MMKREALEKCLKQWQWLQNELELLHVAQEDGEVFQPVTLNRLKLKYFKHAGIDVDDTPLGLCYLCEYAKVDGISDCLVCPLKGYAWAYQCEALDSPYIKCEECVDADYFDIAAKHAAEIVEAAKRALNDL